jgi:hypothetical protein
MYILTWHVVSNARFAYAGSDRSEGQGGRLGTLASASTQTGRLECERSRVLKVLVVRDSRRRSSGGRKLKICSTCVRRQNVRRPKKGGSTHHKQDFERRVLEASQTLLLPSFALASARRRLAAFACAFHALGRRCEVMFVVSVARKRVGMLVGFGTQISVVDIVAVVSWPSRASR